MRWWVMIPKNLKKKFAIVITLHLKLSATMMLWGF